MKIENRKVRLQYKILETLEAGVVLTGAEVKSVRAGRVDLGEGFIRIQNGEAYLKNVYIYPYLGARPDYNPRMDRKLLMHKHQIMNLQGKLSKGGMTLVPLSLYTRHNFIKVEVALGQSKSKVDRRRDIKERDDLRRIEQELKGVK